MTNYEIVSNYLKAEPKARERKNKDRAIANILIKRYPFINSVPKEILIEAMQDFNTLDRCWRQVTQLQPELRGKDYHQKEKLIHKKQQELGYYPK
jgi:hypothetical protein